jgi:hypothetical protein
MAPFAVKPPAPPAPNIWLGQNDTMKLAELSNGVLSDIDPDVAMRESFEFVTTRMNQLTTHKAVRLAWLRMLVGMLLKTYAIGEQTIAPEPVTYQMPNKKGPQSVQSNVAVARRA